MLDAGNLGAVIGRAAGGDQHVFRRDRLAGREPQRMGVFEHRAGLDHAGAGFFDIGGVDASEPGDLPVLVGDQGRPVEGRVRDGPAEAGGIRRSRAGCARRSRTASSARSRGSRRCRPCGIPRRSSPWRHGRRRSGRREPRPTLLRSRTDRRRTQPWQPLFAASGESRMVGAPNGELAIRYSPLAMRESQICLPRLRISARNSPLTTSANSAPTGSCRPC